MKALEAWRRAGSGIDIRVDGLGYTVSGVDAVRNEYIKETTAPTLSAAITIALYTALEASDE